MDQTSQSEKAYQKQVYEEILNTLYKAGYYRVQINTLSEFDKVVGGLCWSILSSGDNVDVDILFRENLNIGQKIALSEAIVKALRKMGCPHPLQAHQIQGGQGHLSDFPAIQPVILWLIKKTVAFKEKRNAQLRAYATQQFKKNYSLPKDSTEEEILSSKELMKLIQKQKVTRKFKRAVLSEESQDARILSCLIEYGESFNLKKGSGGGGASAGKNGAKGDSKNSQFTFIDESVEEGEDKVFRITVDDSLAELTADAQATAATATKAGASDSVDLNEFDKKLAKVVKETEEEDAKFQEQLVNAESNMRSQMTEIQAGSATGIPISGSQVGAIVSQNASEISSAAAQYTEQTKQIKKLFETQGGGAGSSSGGVGGGAPQSKYLSLVKQKEIFSTQMAELNQKIKTLKERVTAPAHAALQGKYEAAVQERQTAVEYLEKLNAKYRLLQELEAKYSPQQKHIEELSRLVALRDQLKKEEEDFRAACKAQMLQLKEKIHLYETADPDQIAQDANEEARMKEIEDAFEKVSVTIMIYLSILKSIICVRVLTLLDIVYILILHIFIIICYICKYSICIRYGANTRRCASESPRSTSRWLPPRASSTMCPRAGNSFNTSVGLPNCPSKSRGNSTNRRNTLLCITRSPPSKSS